MKRMTIALMLLPGLLQAANEVRAVIDGSPTAYFVVREIDGDVWYPVGGVFEAWGGGAGRTMADYDIALTNHTGGFYSGTFPAAIATDTYYVVAHQQSGGSPADTDPPVWVELGNWDNSGSTWNPGSVDVDSIADAVWDEAVADHTTETSFGGEVGGLDPNLTLVKATTDLLIYLETTVSVTDTNDSFTMADGPSIANALDGSILLIQDLTDSHFEVRFITDCNATNVVVLDEPLSFDPAVSDPVYLMSTGYMGLIYTIWELVQNLGSVVNVFDTTGSSRQGLGDTTLFDAVGDDP